MSASEIIEHSDGQRKINEYLPKSLIDRTIVNLGGLSQRHSLRHRLFWFKFRMSLSTFYWQIDRQALLCDKIAVF